MWTMALCATGKKVGETSSSASPPLWPPRSSPIGCGRIRLLCSSRERFSHEARTANNQRHFWSCLRSARCLLLDPCDSGLSPTGRAAGHPRFGTRLVNRCFCMFCRLRCHFSPRKEKAGGGQSARCHWRRTSIPMVEDYSRDGPPGGCGSCGCIGCHHNPPAAA